MDAEKKSKMFKRSIYIVKDMEEGDIFTEENIRIIRPGLGLAPKYFEVMLGKKIKKAVKRGTALSFDLI
jgi:sialic acid synthase SpsE